VTYGRSSFKLVGLAKGDFPKFPSVPEPIARLDAPLLGACVKKTSFAVSGEESRYVLNGALLKLKPDRVTMVATGDGHRLALTERTAQIANLKEELSVLIPHKERRYCCLALPRKMARELASKFRKMRRIFTSLLVHACLRHAFSPGSFRTTNRFSRRRMVRQ
jgi:hypothetical protein